MSCFSSCWWHMHMLILAKMNVSCKYQVELYGTSHGTCWRVIIFWLSGILAVDNWQMSVITDLPTFDSNSMFVFAFWILAIRYHPFSTYAEFSKSETFLNPWQEHVPARIWAYVNQKDRLFSYIEVSFKVHFICVFFSTPVLFF